MQEAATASVLIPVLLEQIFERFSYKEDQGSKENLLLDLHKLLGGRLVSAALNVLDHQTVVIYSNNPKTIEIAEICDPKSSLRIRLFPKINYCTCEYFKERVLNKESINTASYTCQHVLAVRLAIALEHARLQFKEVPTHDLDILLSSFTPTSSVERK